MIADQNPQPTAVLIFADGTYFFGIGHGASTTKNGEVVFNTAMTGYQECLTDPSYDGQILCFTFPHIGIVGCNEIDTETMGHLPIKISGAIFREPITESSNWRAKENLHQWLMKHDIPAISGIDTRALTAYIRDNGAPLGMIHVNYNGEFDLAALILQAKKTRDLTNLDLAIEVSVVKNFNDWQEGLWQLKSNEFQTFGPLSAKFHIVAIDYGSKKQIYRILTQLGCRITIVPANCDAKTIMSLNPDGIFLSNGPGDPAATGEYAVPVIKQLIAANYPIFGICLGHQLLGLALGAKTRKMALGHHGANHPIWDYQSQKVIITSQNHGFVVDEESLPEDINITHKSLFDDSIAGIQAKNKPIYSVQFHPEASPGPEDNYYLFAKFMQYLAHDFKQYPLN